MNDSKKDRKRRRRESAKNEDSETRKKRNSHYKNLNFRRNAERKERKLALLEMKEGRSRSRKTPVSRTAQRVRMPEREISQEENDWFLPLSIEMRRKAEPTNV